MNPFGIAPLLDRGAYRLDPYERFLIAKIKTGQYCAALWDSNSLFLEGPRHYPAGETFAWKITPAMAEMAKQAAAERQARWKAEAPERARRSEQRKAEKAARDAEWARVNREWEGKRNARIQKEAERVAAWEAEEKRLAAEKEARAKREAEREAWQEREEAARKARWQERERQAEEELEGLRPKRAAEAARARPVTAAEVERIASRRQAERQRIMAAPWQCKKCMKKATIDPWMGGFKLSCSPCDESTFADHDLLVRVVEAQAA